MRLAQCGRECTASLVAHLAELHRRRLHLAAGYSSLFTYCVGALGLSGQAAYDRMKAAKVARRYPLVIELLASGRVNLTTVRLLAPHLTRDNQQELFAASCGKRKRQVLELLARHFPKPDVSASVRRMPARQVTSAPVAMPTARLRPVLMNASTGSAAATVPSVAAGEERATAGMDMVVVAGGDGLPLAAIPMPPAAILAPPPRDRHRFTFTFSAADCEKLELARDLLRHAVPSGDPAVIFDRALDILVSKLERERRCHA